MACILLFLEKRLRQDKAESTMLANSQVFSKEHAPESSPDGTRLGGAGMEKGFYEGLRSE